MRRGTENCGKIRRETVAADEKERKRNFGNELSMGRGSELV